MIPGCRGWGQGVFSMHHTGAERLPSHDNDQHIRIHNARSSRADTIGQEKPYVSQTDSEQQLRIWKDLAISKQMLMNEAASALKLRDDFSAEELREALDHAVARARDADKDMAETRSKAEQEVAEMQQTVRATEKARADAEAARDAANEAREKAEQQLENGRRDNAEALKKAKRQVEDKQKELKAINQALADTPENIVKKLKQLKKQKLDEGNARKVAEDSVRKLRKETKTQKEELEKLGDIAEAAASLLNAHRELNDWVDQQRKALDDAGVEYGAPPAVDAEVLATIEAATAVEEDTRQAATA